MVVEVKSKADSIDKLRKKIQDFINLGSQVGILINPKIRTVEVSCNGETVILKDGDILKLPDLLPAWEVTIPEI